MTDDRPVSLPQVRGKHPGWSIGLENGVYVAVNRPAQSAQHIVVFHDLAELDERLDELDGR